MSGRTDLPVWFGWVLLFGVLIAGTPAVATELVQAAVIRSQGTQFLGMTIWNELNTGWSDFGNTPVQIDYTSLAGNNLTLPQIQDTDADVLILSCPGFLTYKTSEIDAIISYVNAGHGLIISYGNFRSEDRRLAPLVGLSESTSLGTATWPDPFSFELIVPQHPVLSGLSSSYTTGVRVLASPIQGSQWQIATTATVLAEARPTFQQFIGDGIILANETEDYRGLYFAHYIENKSGGSNQQDMQVLYNGLLWTAGVPEPATGLLSIIGMTALLRRRREG